MQFSHPPARQKPESIVPMINVVFLLLIFFMMTATITQPTPFDVTPPDARREGELQEDTTLFVAADGRLGMNGLLGNAVWPALGAMQFEGPLTIRADAALPAKDLSGILNRLAELGVTSIELVVAQK
ncbi:MAG: biopolymer transporter ExbD [Yoonia sp.]|jgi:biopolymer transport protein ExbD|nr:biopolymer transporter ExbD [Yoonia sp.]